MLANQQFERAKRKYTLIQEIHEGIKHKKDTAYYEDSFYDFFIHCYHVKDWIKNDSSIDNNIRQSVEGYIDKNLDLKICADICNGVKHLVRTKKQIKSGSERKIVQKAISIQMGDEPLIQLIFYINDDKGNINSFDLATRCIELWENFFKINKLT